jgi:esterase/lipase/1-acyl-sn-glycerol-3-phosphate acyltransferase
MNRFAYLATGQMIALLQNLSKVRVIIHGRENIPSGPVIFVVNHFTRIETLLLPYHIYQLTGKPVWSLADATFFDGPLSGFLARIGAVSTGQPDRDRLMVKSLLTGEANWIIFPEGRMVKDKVLVDPPRFFPFGKRRRPQPHTGAATLALRTEFYRQRLLQLATEESAEVERLRGLFQIKETESVVTGETCIVPVNITYYPLRSHENALSWLADRFSLQMSDRLREEILTEGTMLVSGVDIDIRFGEPLGVRGCLASTAVERDMYSRDRIDFDDRLQSRPVMRQEATGLMKQYMADIYNMATVNHDHLFSSLLKALPFSRISEDEFRRRVFLLAAAYLHKTGVHCHQSLAIGQVALLTDDRYHKYREFSLLGQETGVLELHDGMLVKDSSKFNKLTDLHRARIDNPIGVIANEVVPLASLQQEVRKMAWMPGVMVRHLVAGFLERQALAEFDADYREFHQPGETKGREIGSPRLMKGKQRDIGVVLVHGFLAAPRELQELAEYLNRQGLWVYLVRLKGHGTSPADLADRTGPNWVESVDLGYALMNSICRRVVLGGFSFGGGIVLDCAVRVGRVAGVFAVSPPLRLLDFSTKLAPAITAWNRVMDWLSYEEGKKEFVASDPERPQINYARIPIAAIWELERFMKRLEPRLSLVTVPALVLQGDNDPLVDPAGSRILFSLLGSTDKEYQSFPFDRHGILAGDGSDKVHQVIGRFVERLRSQPA